MKKEFYFAPAIEEILMEVENGIAASTGEGFTFGADNDSNYNETGNDDYNFSF